MYLQVYETRWHDWLAKRITEKEAKNVAQNPDNHVIFPLYTESVIFWPESGLLYVANESEDMPGTLEPYAITTVSILQTKDGLLIHGI